jgi:propionyl-CoA synthetase
MSRGLQDEVYAASIRDPEAFWSRQAAQLHWFKKPSQALKRTTKTLQDGTSHDHWTWFPDGELNTTYNCVDRHVENGRGDVVAISYDSPVTGTKQKFTYSQLLQEVETLAGVLREEGVMKGDVVLIYSTCMIIQTAVPFGGVCSAMQRARELSGRKSWPKVQRQMLIADGICGIDAVHS